MYPKKPGWFEQKMCNDKLVKWRKKIRNFAKIGKRIYFLCTKCKKENEGVLWNKKSVHYRILVSEHTIIIYYTIYIEVLIYYKQWEI